MLAHPLGSLVFQQKLVPFELRMAQGERQQDDGANEFFGARCSCRRTAARCPTRPAPTRSDFFAAAQFLEMSQDDRLTKPSFEAFTAGYELSDDSFELGEIVEETLNYEEADLGAPRMPRSLRAHRARRCTPKPCTAR